MKKKRISVAWMACVCLLGMVPVPASAQDKGEELTRQYNEYQERFAAIETLEDLKENGYVPLESQSFPVLLESLGEEEVTFLPVMEERYHRLGILIADSQGNVLFKTNQLETNYKWTGQLRQPVRDIASVSFQDLDGDGLTDIVLITNCQNDTGDYAGKVYKVGDVLFQKEGGFYRDWRISDKINRFSMNKSADFIAAYVRDGISTEVLYTATTLEELLENGFQVVQEQCYYRNFEKQGRLQVVPGSIRMAGYDTFMVYLVNEQVYIVWSFQPMEDYDNLYALKGMACRDLDGDGLKDLVVLARYSYAGEDGTLMVDTRCSIYYQRTDGFVQDTEFEDSYQCTEEDTVNGLVDIIREYWGWTKEE